MQVRAFPVRKAQGLQVRAVIHTGVPPQTLALREAIAQKPDLQSEHALPGLADGRAIGLAADRTAGTGNCDFQSREGTRNCVLKGILD